MSVLTRDIVARPPAAPPVPPRVEPPVVPLPALAQPRAGGRLPAYVLCMCAAIFLECFSGNTKQLGFPIGPDRLLMGLALVLYALDPEAPKAVLYRLRPIHLLMILYVVWAVVSAGRAGTLGTSAGVYALLDRLGIVPFLAFTLAPVFFGTARRRDFLLKVLVVLGIYLSVTAVFESLKIWALVFPSYISDPTVGIHYGRARGPFVESVADGTTMFFCAVAAGIGWARFRGSKWQPVCGLTAVLCVVGVMLTLTRAVWIGSALGVVAALLLTRGMRKWLIPIGIAGTLLVAAVFVLVPGYSSAAKSRADDERSVWDRLNVNAAAVRVIDAKPLSGLGWGTFAAQGVNWVRQADTYPITNVTIEVHNVALARTAELGIPGGLLWAGGLIAGPGLATFRRQRDDLALWRTGFIAIFVAWFTDAMTGPMPYALPNLLLWVFCGITLQRYLTHPSATSRTHAIAAWPWSRPVLRPSGRPGPRGDVHD